MSRKTAAGSRLELCRDRRSRVRELLGDASLTYTQIGLLVGVTKERIRQIHNLYFSGAVPTLTERRKAVSARKRLGKKVPTPQHGFSRSAEYRASCAMKRRCLNPIHKQYSGYGGRGITVCPEWISSFVPFFSCVGPRPSPKHSLDRYPDNDGNYEPGNVRWATIKEQQNNRRDNVVVVVDGTRVSLSVFYDTNLPVVPKQTFFARVRRGWNLMDAVHVSLIPPGTTLAHQSDSRLA